jgi:hypothetical protein
MRESSKIGFFGCSFTELETSNNPHNFISYKKLLSAKLNKSFNSYAKSGASNAEIINKVYLKAVEVVEHPSDSNDELFVIQFSFLNRLGLYSDLHDGKFWSFTRFQEFSNEEKQRTTTEEIVSVEFYRDYLKYFHSKRGSILEFEKQVNLICSWLNNNNIKFVCIGFDEYMDLFSPNFYENNNFVKFNNTYSFFEYAKHHKLRISDLNEDWNDKHLSDRGHQMLTDFIYQKVKNLYLN